MTRIAAGQPAIWPGICDDNAEAIVATLDLLIDSLGAMRRRVAERDHDSLLEVLERAATARRAMSERAPRPEELVEVRIPVLDRPGTLAEIASLATELGINIFDVEIAHSVEGDRGVLVAGHRRRGVRRRFTAALAGQGAPVQHLTGRERPVTADHRDPAGSPGGGRWSGPTTVPGDKSISHRALLLAALAEGTSAITGLSTGDDVARTRAAVAALGAGVDERDGVVTVVGGRSRLTAPDDVVDLGNSGTGMRLLAGVVAGLAGVDPADRRRLAPRAADGPGGRTPRRAWARR